MASSPIFQILARFDPSKGEKYDPGQLVILFDNRICTTVDDKFSKVQSYWTSGLYRLGWPSFYKMDLDPGMIRLIWYTHAGNEGQRDFALWQAYRVKDMFDDLSREGFRPMILGWSGENPYPMIGGSEPPAEPKKPKMRVATTWSKTVSGHGNDSGTPLDRVNAIISREDEREAEKRRKEVERAGEDAKSPV